jgi:hypothetical protein
MSLLSGGERALTAHCDSVCDFKAEASPFCILDEIDAALDEANVDILPGSWGIFPKKRSLSSLPTAKVRWNAATAFRDRNGGKGRVQNCIGAFARSDRRTANGIMA